MNEMYPAVGRSGQIGAEGDGSDGSAIVGDLLAPVGLGRRRRGQVLHSADVRMQKASVVAQRRLHRVVVGVVASAGRGQRIRPGRKQSIAQASDQQFRLAVQESAAVITILFQAHHSVIIFNYNYLLLRNLLVVGSILFALRLT